MPQNQPAVMFKFALFHALSPTTQAMLWAALAGLLFTLLNTIMRVLALQLDAFQTQFLRYACGLAFFLPLLLRHGWRAYQPQHIGGQFSRGAFHTLGLVCWFSALPHISIADTTAIGFMGPVFIMLGAAWFLNERMYADRWIASGLAFAGVLVVVGPHMGGSHALYQWLMLAAVPLFSASFLINKALTRYESTRVIVFWQSLTVTIFSLPLGVWAWQNPSAGQWALFVICGAMGSLGHLCLTKAFSKGDISATQALKFLELVWASLWGWLIFSDVPAQTTLIGGGIICAATIWIARREAQRRPQQPLEPPAP